jgi:ATP-binding cassette subfamily B protein
MAANIRGNTALSDIQLEELLAKTSLERGMFMRLLPLLAPVKKWVIGAIIIEALLVAAIFMRPWLVSYLIDNGFIRSTDAINVNYDIIFWTAIAFTLTWAARFVLAGFGQYFGGRAAIHVINELRIRVFTHVQKLSVGYFDRTKAGRITARADSDVNALEPLLIQGPPELLSALLRCVVAGVMLWLISPLLFASVVAIVPIMAIATAIFKKISQRNWGIVAENRSRFTAHLVETVAGVRVIKQNAYESINQKRYYTLVDNFNKALVHGNIRASWFAPFTAILTTAAMAVLLVVGGRGVALDQITMGQLAASLFYVFIFLAPLQELSDLFERYANGSACAQRIFLLLDTQPEILDPENPQPLPKVEGHVSFNQVKFSYVPNAKQWVIDDLNLHLPAGEVLAIVGPTGHGKSTLVQLLTRFYDVNDGSVTIDGINVKDLRQTDLRRHVGVVQR